MSTRIIIGTKEKPIAPDKVFSFSQKVLHSLGVVGWCKGVVYLTSLGHPIDIGLQLGKACYPCNR